MQNYADRKTRKNGAKLIGTIISKLDNPETKAGGVSRLAERLGITPSGVSQIVSNAWIPASRVKTLVQIANDLKIEIIDGSEKRAVNASDFRPDLF